MIRKLLNIFTFGLLSTNAVANGELETIYPYVVPEGYLKSMPAEDKEALSWAIGNGLHVILISRKNNKANNLTIAKLKALKISPEEAKKKAIDNLEKLAEAGEIKQTAFNGPSDKPFILMGGHWATATAILLPSLSKMGEKVTGTPDLLVSIPHREALLVFGNISDDYIEKMKKIILEKESSNPRPLTFELFSIKDGKILPYEK